MDQAESDYCTGVRSVFEYRAWISICKDNNDCGFCSADSLMIFTYQITAPDIKGCNSEVKLYQKFHLDLMRGIYT